MSLFHAKLAVGIITHSYAHAHNKLKKAEHVLLWHIIRHAYIGLEKKKHWQLWFPAWLPNQTHRPKTDEEEDISDALQ